MSNNSEINSTVLALRDWALKKLSLNVQEIEFTPLSGDASFRRYWRLRAQQKASSQEKTWIVVFAPPATEKNQEFAAVARYLHRAGLIAPEVLAVDLAQGFMLLSDLGDSILLPILLDAQQKKSADANLRYQQALDVLLKMQLVDIALIENWSLPLYNAQRLRDEMALFPEWFVTQLLQCPLDAATTHLINNMFAALIEKAFAVKGGLNMRSSIGLGGCAQAHKVFGLAAKMPVVYQFEKQRHQKHRQEGGGQHAAQHARANRLARRRPGPGRKSQWHHAQNKGQ